MFSVDATDGCSPAAIALKAAAIFFRPTVLPPVSACFSVHLLIPSFGFLPPGHFGSSHRTQGSSYLFSARSGFCLLSVTMASTPPPARWGLFSIWYVGGTSRPTARSPSSRPPSAGAMGLTLAHLSDSPVRPGRASGSNPTSWPAAQHS